MGIRNPSLCIKSIKEIIHTFIMTIEQIFRFDRVLGYRVRLQHNRKNWTRL